MADVKVNIKGDSKGLGNAVDRAKAKLKELQNSASRSTRGLRDGFKGALSSGKLLAPSLALITSGLASIERSSRRAFKTFEEGAKRAESAAKSALTTLANVNVATPGAVDITSRDQLVELGRNAQARLSDINAQLDQRGLLVQLQETDNILQGITQSAVRIAGLFSDQVRASQANTQNLLTQRAEAQASVDFAQQELSLLDARIAKFKELNKVAGTSPTIAAAPSAETSIAAVPENNLANFAEKLFSQLKSKAQDLPAVTLNLPSNSTDFFEDIDEPIAQATVNLNNFNRALDAGLVGGLEAAQQQADLLRERLFVMIEQRVPTSSAGFQQLKAQLDSVQASIDSLNTKNAVIASTFNIVGDIGSTVLGDLVFKFEEANSAAAKFRNTLRGIGRRLLSIGIGAITNLGIGALTGNPLSFGAAFASAAGVPVPTAASVTPSTPASVVGGKVPTVSPSSFGGSGPLQVEVVPRFERVSGGDFVIGFNQAESTFKRRGGA